MYSTPYIVHSQNKSLYVVEERSTFVLHCAKLKKQKKKNSSDGHFQMKTYCDFILFYFILFIMGSY
jgi:hypothetical protein